MYCSGLTLPLRSARFESELVCTRVLLSESGYISRQGAKLAKLETQIRSGKKICSYLGVLCAPSTWLLCGCQVHYIRDLFFLFPFMTFLLPDQRETCCYAWHGTRPSHLLGMRPSLGHKAPGSLSQGSNRQEFFSPGSPRRRVVPWGDVSSWVKGAE